MATKITADLRSAPDLDGPWRYEVVVHGEMTGTSTCFQWPNLKAEPGRYYRIENIRATDTPDARASDGD